MPDIYNSGDSSTDAAIAADVARVFDKNFAEYNRNADRYGIGKMQGDDRTYMINKSLAEVDARNKQLRLLAQQAAEKEARDADAAARAAANAARYGGSMGGNPYNFPQLPTASPTSSKLANWQAGLAGAGTIFGLLQKTGLLDSLGFGPKNPYIESVKQQEQLQEYLRSKGLLPKFGGVSGMGDPSASIFRGPGSGMIEGETEQEYLRRLMGGYAQPDATADFDMEAAWQAYLASLQGGYPGDYYGIGESEPPDYGFGGNGE